MLAISVCDDEAIECSNMAKRIRKIMEEMRTAQIFCKRAFVKRMTGS